MDSLDMEKTLKDTPTWLSNNYCVLFWCEDEEVWNVSTPLDKPEDFSILLETKSFRKAMNFFMKFKVR